MIFRNKQLLLLFSIVLFIFRKIKRFPNQLDFWQPFYKIVHSRLVYCPFLYSPTVLRDFRSSLWRGSAVVNITRKKVGSEKRWRAKRDKCWPRLVCLVCLFFPAIFLPESLLDKLLSIVSMFFALSGINAKSKLIREFRLHRALETLIMFSRLRVLFENLCGSKIFGKYLTTCHSANRCLDDGKPCCLSL